MFLWKNIKDWNHWTPDLYQLLMGQVDLKRKYTFLVKEIKRKTSLTPAAIDMYWNPRKVKLKNC